MTIELYHKSHWALINVLRRLFISLSWEGWTGAMIMICNSKLKKGAENILLSFSLPKSMIVWRLQVWRRISPAAWLNTAVHSHTHTHTRARWYMWFTSTLHWCNGFYILCILSPNNNCTPKLTHQRKLLHFWNFFKSFGLCGHRKYPHKPL